MIYRGRASKSFIPHVYANLKVFYLLWILWMVLIIGSFNYLFQLIIEPMFGVIPTGKPCILKAADNTPYG